MNGSVIRRRRPDHFRSPSITDTEYFSDDASHTISTARDHSQSTSEVESSNEDSESDATPIASGSTLRPPSITHLSDEFKVQVDAEEPESVGGRAWYEFDLVVVLSLLPPIANWLTGGDIFKNILLVLFLIFYLHQIIEVPWALYLASRPRRAPHAPRQDHASTVDKCHRTALSELRTLETLYFILSLLSPFIGLTLLRTVTVSFFGTSSLSWFSSSLFVLAAGVRPWNHGIQRFREQTTDLHTLIHYPPPHAQKMQALIDRIEQLEGQLKSLRKQSKSFNSEVYEHVEDAIEMMEITTRRQDKRAEVSKSFIHERLEKLEHDVETLLEQMEIRADQPAFYRTIGQISTFVSALINQISPMLPAWVVVHFRGNLPRSPRSSPKLGRSRVSIKLETIPEVATFQPKSSVQSPSYFHIPGLCLFLRISGLVTLPLRRIITYLLSGRIYASTSRTLIAWSTVTYDDLVFLKEITLPIYQTHTSRGAALYSIPPLDLTAWTFGFKYHPPNVNEPANPYLPVLMYAEIPAISFISTALTLIPLTWYYRARNVAAVAIGVWLSIANMIYAIDSLLWADDVNVKAPVWCDISTALITGFHIALPAACLSICIHLERLAGFSQTCTPQAKRRRFLFEYLMSFGVPLVYIALHSIVQPHRFDLFYGFGCRPASYPSVATIFLIMIPPLLLTVGTIICACVAWRHFLVHGVHFYGKKGSVPSLTRDLYVRLVGMVLLEAIFSAAVIGAVAWRVLRSGLTPLKKMSRNLSEVGVWGADELTGSVRTMLMVEWLLTVVQSLVFFGLFACRMEVLHEGWEFVQSSLRSFRRPAPPTALRQSSPARSSFAGTLVQTLPKTEVDLSLIIESASTLNKSLYTAHQLKGIAPRRSSAVEDAGRPEDVVMAAFAPSTMPLESPTRAPATASSHNSVESIFKFMLSPDVWPRTPTATPAVPVPVCLSRRSFGMERMIQEQEPRAGLGRWDEVGREDMLPPLPPLPRAKYGVRRPCFSEVFDDLEERGMARRQAVYMTVTRETRSS